MIPRVLVAGIGNIFLGDDGFGPEVIRHINHQFLRDDSVQITDYGTGGVHLAYDLLDNWTALVLVDALPNRGAPGTVQVFEADHTRLKNSAALDAHGMDPGTVFASLRALGGIEPRTIVVGCQVCDITDRMGLSEPVRSAVASAADAVIKAVTLLQNPASNQKE